MADTSAIPYLGTPGAMLALPSPNGPVTADPTRAESAHVLLSGGTVMQRRLAVKRTFQLPYSALTPDDADLLLAFYQGLFGEGPFVYIDPSVRNILPLDPSTLGLRPPASHGWTSSSGALAYAPSTVAQPTQTRGMSDVVQWTGVANAVVGPCVASYSGTTPTVDITTAPVYVAAEMVTWSVWLRCSSSSALITPRLSVCNAAGAQTSIPAYTAVTVGTTWTQITASAAVGASGYSSAIFLAPGFAAGSTPPGTLYIAGAQLEFQTLSTFQPGFGCPRVVLPSTVGRSIPVINASDHTLTLAEV